jgi:hypothetical protein
LHEGDEVEDEEEYIEKENMVDEDKKGPPISWREFETSIRCLQDNKATGPDNIPAELLTNMGEGM